MDVRRFDDNNRVGNLLVEDNIKFDDDSLRNFTRTIINNSGTGNVIISDDPKYKAPEKLPDISSANKVTKIAIVLNLMLLFSIFLNM